MPLTAAEEAELKQLQQSLGVTAVGGGGGLSPAEQAELDMLQKQFGARQQPGLSPAEQAELQMLEKQLAPGPPPLGAPPAVGVTPSPAAGIQPQQSMFQQVLGQITDAASGDAGERSRLLAKDASGKSQAERMGEQMRPFYGVPEALTGFTKTLVGATGGVSGLKDTGASTVGEIAGRIVGTAGAPLLGPAAPAGPAIGGAVGSAVGLAAGRTLQGKDVSAKELAQEAFFSVLPEAVLKPLSAIYRKTLSRTAKGLEATKDLAAEWLLKHGPSAFQPKEKKVLDTAYDIIRGSGAMVNPKGIARPLEAFGKKKLKRLETEMLKFSDGPRHQFPNAGEHAVDLFNRIRAGEDISGVDLGYLTHLRSEARKGAFKGRDPAVQDMLDTLADSIDTVINKGEFTQGDHMRDFLAKTQKDYARYKDAEDLEEFLWRGGVVGRNPSNSQYTLNLGKLVTSLRNPGSNKLAGAAQRALLKPGNEKALQQIEEFVQRMSGFEAGIKAAKEGQTALTKKGVFTVNIEPGILAKADHGVVGSLILGGLSTVLGAGPASRERFMRIVAQKRGKLALEDLTVLANLMRREATMNNQPLEEMAPR